jgi:hypothetical protein
MLLFLQTKQLGDVMIDIANQPLKEGMASFEFVLRNRESLAAFKPEEELLPLVAAWLVLLCDTVEFGFSPVHRQPGMLGQSLCIWAPKTKEEATRLSAWFDELGLKGLIIECGSLEWGALEQLEPEERKAA